MTKDANIEDMERCFEHFVIKDDDTSPEEEYEVSDVSHKTENEYRNELRKGSGLEILKKNLVQQRAYEDRKRNRIIPLIFQSVMPGKYPSMDK
jgi:hypothetical protein